jgi:DNA-binding beta-propeller fold protein YncE
VIRAFLFSLFFAALSAQPLLLVLQKGSSSLGFYSLSGEKLSETAVGQHPHEMVLSADRRFLYCTDNGTMLIEQAGTGGNTVSIIDLKTRQRVGQIGLGKYRRPHGIDLDAKTGNLLISTELPDQLLLADPKSSARTRQEGKPLTS